MVSGSTAIQSRGMSGGHKTMYITPSRFQWHKFKDLTHFYLMLGIIPATAVVLYTNLFIGPAQLTECPEDYVPKHWEYHRHPISRFIARYIHPSPQQEYEKMCHFIHEESEKLKLRELESRVKAMIGERRDYQAYYYKDVTAKYHRIAHKTAKELEAIYGDN